MYRYIGFDIPIEIVGKDGRRQGTGREGVKAWNNCLRFDSAFFLSFLSLLAFIFISGFECLGT